MQPNPKQVHVGVEARNKALEGVEKVYEAVSATLGPRSANVAIARPFGRPAVVHDGVTVAKEVIPLKDPVENIGAELAVEAADKTNAIGDGTTTATVLMRNIAKGAHTYIVAGAKPMALRAGIEAATKAVIAAVTNQAKPIEGVEDVRRIATISAQLPEIGDMVADAYEALGPEGIMSVEESRSGDTYLDIKTGLQFDRGYRNPYFVTEPGLDEAVVTEPYILVTDHTITSAVQDMAPLMSRLAGEGVKDIVIVAKDVDAEALAFLIANKVRGNLNCLVVQAPSFGDKQTEMLKDIALATGATPVLAQAGMGLESVTKATLGTAAKVISTHDTTLIIAGAGSAEDVDKRAEELKAKADSPDTNQFDREKLLERYAKLKSGVAVLTIGAKSESELKERKERAIDAISAAQAALHGGIVPGGGTALIEACNSEEYGTTYGQNIKDRDFIAGMDLVLEACQAPFRKLLSNAGYDPGTFIEKVGKGKGVDVMTGQVVDMVKAGIIDPTQVVTSALANASSNAVMLATTNVFVVEAPADATV